MISISTFNRLTGGDDNNRIVAGKYINNNLKRMTDDHLALLICAVEEVIPVSIYKLFLSFFYCGLASIVVY